ALQAWTWETAPDNYLTVQQNLGDAYTSLATLDTANAADHLQRAGEAYRAVLLPQAKDKSPIAYAWILCKLATTERSLAGQSQEKSVHLRQGLAYCEEALDIVRMPEMEPDVYGNAHNQRGLLHRELARLEAPADHLTQAVTAYTTALQAW